jgi:homocysteine S-methyltransferase
MDFHRRKFVVLAEETPDAVAIETIPNLLECRAVMQMLTERDYNDVAVWISLACQDGDLLNDGSRLENALDIIHEMDPSAQYGVGINCCDSLYGTCKMTVPIF